MTRHSHGTRRTRALASDDLALPLYIALCLMLGGSSYGGYVANALIQLVGVALLAWLGIDPRRRAAAGMGPALGAMLIAYVGWATLTLVPLPAVVWRHAGGRGFLVADYALLGMPPPTRPLSLDPDRTIAAALGVVPFAAALALALAATDRARAAAAITAIGVALLSIPLGALQLLGGPASRWYLYAPTNHGNTVGFFANANHLATLFLMTLPFVAEFAVAVGRGAASPWASGGVFAFMLFGIALDGSVAGLLLAVPATVGSALVYRRGIGRPVRRGIVAGLAVAMTATVVSLAFGPMDRLLLDRVPAAGTDPVTRETSMRLTAAAARDFLPFGAGPGSFRGLYPSYEDARAVTIEFNVHAHDEYLEIALELGLVGIGLIAGALAWVAWRSAAAWSDAAGAGRERTGSLARAASVSLAMLLLHSLVDFPARTAAIAALAGFAAALLRAPQRGRANPASSRRQPAVHGM